MFCFHYDKVYGYFLWWVQTFQIKSIDIYISWFNISMKLLTMSRWLTVVVNTSSSHEVGHGFVSPWVHSKDHHKNCTNCLPVWHADITRVGVWQCRPGCVWTCLLHLRSPRLLYVRSLGSPWYDYVCFNSVSSGIKWVISLLQWLTKLSI